MSLATTSRNNVVRKDQRLSKRSSQDGWQRDHGIQKDVNMNNVETKDYEEINVQMIGRS